MAGSPAGRRRLVTTLLGRPLGPLLLAVLLMSSTPPSSPGAAPAADPGLRVEEGVLLLPARMYARAYRSHPDRYHGHHALTYAGGGAAAKAFLRTPVPDREIARALDGMGLDDGGGISRRAWDLRKIPFLGAADQRAEGDPLEVQVRWEGSGGWVPLEALLVEASGGDWDLRFVDNRQWIPAFRSGCVICLSSCPGAKIANRGFTMRQNDRGEMEYRPASRELPPEGTPVTVRVVPARRQASTSP